MPSEEPGIQEGELYTAVGTAGTGGPASPGMVMAGHGVLLIR